MSSIRGRLYCPSGESSVMREWRRASNRSAVMVESVAMTSIGISKYSHWLYWVAVSVSITYNDSIFSTSVIKPSTTGLVYVSLLPSLCSLYIQKPICSESMLAVSSGSATSL